MFCPSAPELLHEFYRRATTEMIEPGPGTCVSSMRAVKEEGKTNYPTINMKVRTWDMVQDTEECVSQHLLPSCGDVAQTWRNTLGHKDPECIP